MTRVEFLGMGGLGGLANLLRGGEKPTRRPKLKEFNDKDVLRADDMKNIVDSIRELQDK